MAYVEGSASRPAVLTVIGAEQKIMVSLKSTTNTINVGHPTWYVSDIDAFTL